VDSTHKTAKNFMKTGAFTVSMATAEYVTECDYVGVVSANDVPDKVAKAGFHVMKSEFVNALRVTDKETVDIVQMVLAGKVNKTLVNLLQMKGGHAVGLSGIDGGILEATMKDEALGYVGEVTKIRTQPITDLLEKNYIPVISTIASDRQGNTYNINGDTAAASIAGALGAERLIMMTDIAGILRDKDDPSTLIPAITVSEAKQLFEEGIICGGMIPKVDCCIDAIEKGVKHVVIMDGRVPHSILMELLTDEGAGTMVLGD
jgi:acetylglutamate kinase